MLHFRSLQLQWTRRALLILLSQRSRGYQKRICVLTQSRKWDGDSAEVCGVFDPKDKVWSYKSVSGHWILLILPLPLSDLFSLLFVCAHCVLVHVCRWHQYVSSSRGILFKNKHFNPLRILCNVFSLYSPNSFSPLTFSGPTLWWLDENGPIGLYVWMLGP